MSFLARTISSARKILLPTVPSQSVSMLTENLEDIAPMMDLIYLFDCQFLSYRACYKQYKA